MEYNTQKLQKLLEEVGKIRQKHEEMARLHGEGFNIFDIFRTDENKHSDFIAELLNVNGSHGQGGKFLELFLDMLVRYEIIDNKLAYQNAEVSREVQLTTESRLDIKIKGKQGGTIYIENKIWSGEQNKQLNRYYEVGKQEPYFKLLYLTPEGRESMSADKAVYSCISYKEHIIEWLEACHQATADLPILRETIKQYIIHLKHLTGQAQNNEMEQELSKVILGNIGEAALIQKHTNNTLKALLSEVTINLQNQIDNLKGQLKISIVDVSKLQIDFSNWGIDLAVGFIWWEGNSSINAPIFYLGVVAEPKKFDKQKMIVFFNEKFITTEKQLNFPSEKNNWWLWYEEIKFEKLQHITSPENIARIAKAIEEYAPLCDEIDKNFRKL